MMSISLGEVVTFAAASGLVSAAATGTVVWWDAWRSRKREAGFLAIRLATTFETFAEACMGAIGDADTHRQSGGAAGKLSMKLPALASFPEDENGWRVLPTNVTARVLTFPNNVRAGQGKIDFTWDVADEQATWDECEEECARLGLEAWSLATDLRREFGFPPFEPRYDVAGALRTEVARWNERSLKGSDLLD